MRDSHIFSSNLLLTCQGSYSKFQRDPGTGGPRHEDAAGVRRQGAAEHHRRTSSPASGSSPTRCSACSRAAASSRRRPPGTSTRRRSGARAGTTCSSAPTCSSTTSTCSTRRSPSAPGRSTARGPATCPPTSCWAYPRRSSRTRAGRSSCPRRSTTSGCRTTGRSPTRLTVNAGLRWEPWTPPTDSLNNLVGFVKGQQSTDGARRAAGDGVPGRLRHSRVAVLEQLRRCWRPRIGAAYDVFGDGRTDHPRRLRHLLHRPGADDLHAHGEHPAERADGQPRQPVQLPRTRTTASPAAIPTRSRARDPSEFATFKYVKPVSGGVLDPTNNKGYSQNWNITFEQQLGRTSPCRSPTWATRGPTSSARWS